MLDEKAARFAYGSNAVGLIFVNTAGQDDKEIQDETLRD